MNLGLLSYFCIPVGAVANLLGGYCINHITWMLASAFGGGAMAAIMNCIR